MGPHRLRGPSLMVRETPHRSRRPKIAVKGQHINLADKATRKPAERDRPAIWRKGRHVVAPETRDWIREPAPLAGERKQVDAFGWSPGHTMGRGYPTPVRGPGKRARLSRRKPRLF